MSFMWCDCRIYIVCVKRVKNKESKCIYMYSLYMYIYNFFTYDAWKCIKINWYRSKIFTLVLSLVFNAVRKNNSKTYYQYLK